MQVLSVQAGRGAVGVPESLPGRVPGLYVHVPFCFHKCHYCDFYSITRQTPERMSRFVDLLLAEAGQWVDAAGRGGPSVAPITVFFGGGTPSLLPLAEMRRLVRGLKERFDFTKVVEWTVEANPATLSADFAGMLREEGVDRLSLGAQSFNTAELTTLERHHDPEDVPRSLEIARKAGFERLNLDLIYAIPGQSLAGWMENLEAALALGTEHLSCYGLTYEANTPMAVQLRMGRFAAASDELELAMLHHTRRRLREAGLAPYEISNYARPAAECRHNLLYWNGESYAGLGPSAASHVSGWRWKNRGHLGEWENAVEAGSRPIAEAEHLSEQQRAGELAMLQLRLGKGIEYADFAARSGYELRELYADVLAAMEKAGMLVATTTGVWLSEKGIDVADAVAGEFI